jgi:alkanesulfonate monooxygenase SsuD/methylene tetrahydromethanopterin reductase-like flavin-dependent oxidoreductase (luciferase family)
VQKPHPPIFLGVNTPKARERVVEYCDGWFPLAGRAGDLAAAIVDLRRLAEKAKRDPKSLSVSVYAAATEESAVRQYEEAGAERAIFYLPSAERDTVLPILDKYGKLIQGFK